MPFEATRQPLQSRDTTSDGVTMRPTLVRRIGYAYVVAFRASKGDEAVLIAISSQDATIPRPQPTKQRAKVAEDTSDTRRAEAMAEGA